MREGWLVGDGVGWGVVGEGGVVVWRWGGVWGGVGWVREGWLVGDGVGGGVGWVREGWLFGDGVG